MKANRDFNLLFEYVFPLQRIVSILGIREMINFEQSQDILPYGSKTDTKISPKTGLPYDPDPRIRSDLFSVSFKHVLEMLQFAFVSSKDPRVGTPIDQALIGLDATEEQEAFLNDLEKWIKEHT